MTPEDLMHFAVEFAAETGRAASLRTRAELSSAETAPTYAAQAETAERHAYLWREKLRDGLKQRLHETTGTTVIAHPDDVLPVATWQRGRVEVRATTLDGTRAVRVRYTPAQALAAGAALIACAAITDEQAGGTLTGVLAAFPPNPGSGDEPASDEGRPA